MNDHPLAYLETMRDDIVREWAASMQSSNSLYATRPLPELITTTSTCMDAYLVAIRAEEFEPLNRFLGSIVAMRGAMNFPEHEVVDAFRGFRRIASDHLLRGLMTGEVDEEPVSDVLDAICQVVDYAILRFSEIYYTARVSRPH